MPVLNPPEFLTPEEAAAYLNVQVQTLALWRCTRRYPVPYAKIGRSVRYKRSDLDRFIASRTITPVDELRAFVDRQGVAR
jgi:excisionase family DNA binding protein